MPTPPFEKIAVLGAGSWGTALAVWLAERGHAVTFWGHDPEHIGQLRSTRRNEKYLPGIVLPEACSLPPASPTLPGPTWRFS